MAPESLLPGATLFILQGCGHLNLALQVTEKQSLLRKARSAKLQKPETRPDSREVREGTLERTRGSRLGVAVEFVLLELGVQTAARDVEFFRRSLDPASL